MKVIGFGDNVVDKYLHIKTMYPGGNPVNFAVYAKQLGVDSSYIGVFGNDDIAEHIKYALIDLGIDISCCVVKEGQSGFCEVTLIDGDRVFMDWNEGGISTEDPMVLGERELEYLKKFDLIHSGCFASSEKELKKLKKLGPLVSYDFADEEQFREEDYLKEVCPNIDFALFSCKGLEIEAIKEFQRKITGFGTKYVLATMGTDGSIFYDGQEYYEGTVELVDAVDTMGAGDSFVTAFLIYLLQNGWKKDKSVSKAIIIEALKSAAKFSANNCLVEGAFGYGKKFN